MKSKVGNLREREKGMKQKKGVLDVFDSFFAKEKFKTIIEIGTGSGNFSIYLAKKSKEMSATFITFDIKDISEKVKSRLNKLDGCFYCEDINENNMIERLLESFSRVLILNDGALKLPQFKRFAPLLKKDDCLMSHDYYKHKDEKSSGRITFYEVSEYIEEYKLRVVYENILENFLWLCCIKK